MGNMCADDNITLYNVLCYLLFHYSNFMIATISNILLVIIIQYKKMKKNGRVVGGGGAARFSWMDFFASYCI